MLCFSCSARSETLSTCDVCKRATYCSRECQSAHWHASDGHKLACAAESADGELITHAESLLGRVAAKNPHLFGTVRQCGARKVAVPSSPASLLLLSAVQEAEMPEDDAKRAAARPKRVSAKGKEKAVPDEDKSEKKRRGSSKRVMVKRAAAGPATRKDDATNMNSLPREMVQAIFDEVDLETALRLARTSRAFAEMFRRLEVSPRMLDKIAVPVNSAGGLPRSTWPAELLRRTIKLLLGGLHSGMRTARINYLMDEVRPMTFYMLFLALGRPRGYDYRQHEDSTSELVSLWTAPGDQPPEVDPEEWSILRHMCRHPKCATVPDIQTIIDHAMFMPASYLLTPPLITTLIANARTFHMGYQVYRDHYHRWDEFYPAASQHGMLLQIFSESENLTAVDWANLFYYSYRREITAHAYALHGPDGPSSFNGWGGTLESRPTQTLRALPVHLPGPYIPDDVFARCGNIFNDPTVPSLEKDTDWAGMNDPGPNGENWNAEWQLFVGFLATRRRKTLEQPAHPSAASAATV